MLSLQTPVNGTEGRAQQGPADHGDRRIRAALLKTLRSKGPEHARIVEEMWLPPTQERADIALINGSLSGYEIKSGRDRLSRLPRQITAYDRIFDECALVVHERHLSNALMMLPDWWGVHVAASSESNAIHTVRGCARNPKISPDAQIRLLWRSELESALLQLGVDPALQFTRAELRAAILRFSDPDLVGQIVREALRHRAMSTARIATRQVASSAAAGC
jgi:hypothetical protein